MATAAQYQYIPNRIVGPTGLAPGALIYFYLSGTTTLTTVYSDVDLTTPLANPYSVNAGAQVPDVYYDASTILRVRVVSTTGTVISDDDPWTGFTSDTIPFTQPETGGQPLTIEDAVAEQRSVLRFIPRNLHAGIKARSYTGDLSTYVQKAFDTLGRVFFPNGTYYFNVTAGATFSMQGEPARLTICKPYDPTEAVVKVVPDVFWSYSRSVSDIQFEGSSKTGFGVVVGCFGPSDYNSSPGDEFAQTVTFTRCRFNDLEKGVVCGAGNLGLEFYSTNFHANYYGAYFLNQKNVSGGAMHAGCKYFFGCEFDYNNVGVYINNTTDGFGGVCFHSTIIEASAIDVYCYTTNTRQPVTFIDCWTENASDTGFGPNVTIDTWSGATRSTTSIAATDFIFDGADSDYLFKGGFVCGVRVIGTNTRVMIENAQVESKASFNGNPFVVDAPASSRIYMRAVSSNGGTGIAAGVYVEDYLSSVVPAISSTGTDKKQYRTTPRFNKQTGLGGVGTTADFTTAAASTLAVGSGPASPVNGTVVADGLIYANCNNFVYSFTAAGQFYQITPTILASMVSGRWYVVTFDAKKISGNPRFYVGNLDTSQLMADAAPAGAEWSTLAAIGQAASTDSLALYVSSSDGAAVTFRVSAFQIRGFVTRAEAEAFLRSGIYAA